MPPNFMDEQRNIDITQEMVSSSSNTNLIGAGLINNMNTLDQSNGTQHIMNGLHIEQLQ